MKSDIYDVKGYKNDRWEYLDQVCIPENREKEIIEQLEKQYQDYSLNISNFNTVLL